MVTRGRMLIACTVAVLLAAPAWAQEQRLFGGPPASGQRFMQTASGRQVEVVRGTSSMTAYEDAGQEEIDSQEYEPVPEGEYDADYGSDGGCADGSCTSDGCTTCEGAMPCDQCGLGDCCCVPFWAHRSFVFGEYLYLRPLDAEMAYAFQQNGSGGQGTVPVGRVGVVDQNFQPAFRAGFGKSLNSCATISASFARYQSHGTDLVTAPAGVGGTVQSLILHPNSTNAGSTSSLIQAAYDIDFQMVDIDYRRLLLGGPQSAVNYTFGVTYGKLQQDFQSLGNFTQPSGTILNTTTINFEGVGLRSGLDAERQLGCSRFSGYAKGFINVLFGKFNTSYTQFDTVSTIVEAQSNWTDGRTVPVLEYEVGLNWTSYSGHWRFSTGYYTAFWFNAITTSQYVQAVQDGNFVGLGDTISFNGLVSRAEFRF